MTYTELEEMITLRLGGRAIRDKYFPVQEGEIPSAVRRALKKVAEMIDPSFESLLMPKEVTITGDGTTTKWLIDDIIEEGDEFLRAKSLKIGDNEIYYITNRLANKVSSDVLEDSSSVKTYIYGKYVYILPALSSGEQAIFTYYAYPPDIDENGRRVPDLSYIPPSFHEAVGFYAIWDLGHKLATLSNYDPGYYLQLFKMSFQEAQKGFNEGYSDHIPHIINIYDYEDNL